MQKMLAILAPEQAKKLAAMSKRMPHAPGVTAMPHPAR